MMANFPEATLVSDQATLLFAEARLIHACSELFPVQCNLQLQTVPDSVWPFPNALSSVQYFLAGQLAQINNGEFE
jgi:hypothetical protein